MPGVMRSGRGWKRYLIIIYNNMRQCLSFFMTTAVAIIMSTACGKVVKEPEQAIISVESVTLDPESATIPVDGKVVITASVLPEDATFRTIAWKSSDPAVAAVYNGTVLGVAEGTATITATVGDQTATCSVSVTEKIVLVTSVTLDKTELTLEVGFSETLTATVFPEDATDKTVTWSSTNNSVASVTGGVVTARKEGVTTIKATAGGITATCTVTVPHVYVPVESISLNKTETTIAVGGSETLEATIDPINADEEVTWSSSNETIATVDNGVVVAVAEGIAIITAKAGDKSASCTVTVTHVMVPVESITLNKTETSIPEGGFEVLVATVLPENADIKTVNWSSSDLTIATVNLDGKVKALAAGTAIITAQAGDKSATCTVTVTPVDKTDTATIDDLQDEDTDG